MCPQCSLQRHRHASAAVMPMWATLHPALCVSRCSTTTAQCCAWRAACVCVLRTWPSICAACRLLSHAACAEPVHAKCARGGACTRRDRDERTKAKTNAPAVYDGVESLPLPTAHTHAEVWRCCHQRYSHRSISTVHISYSHSHRRKR